MFRKFFVWACICAAGPGVCAHEDIDSYSAEYDSVGCAVKERFLDEVVVKAASVVQKTDRKVIRPEKGVLTGASDGMDLLRKLQLPGIGVNPITGDVMLAGGGSVELRINGIQATAAQIVALRPEDIQRIEYHDSPGARYEGSDAVIDYVTRRHDDGGSIAMDAFGAFGSGRWASIDHFSGNFSRGRSVWSANIGYMGQHKDKWVRDYEEVWHYPDHDVSRREAGMPVTVGMSGLESRLSYNYMSQRGHVVNVSAGFDFSNVPAKEEGDRRALLYVSECDVPVLVEEHTEERSYTPFLGVYGRYMLNQWDVLVFESTVSCMKSDVFHEYGENAFSCMNTVRGRTLDYRIKGVYENRRGSRTWGVGLSHNGAFTSNRYSDSDEADITSVYVSRRDSRLFGEFGNRYGRWGIVADAGMAFRTMVQSGYSLSRVFVDPGIGVSFQPVDNLMLRYRGELSHKLPSVAAVSDAEQTIQLGMVRKGNPGLRPSVCVDQSLTASFSHRLASVEGRVGFMREADAVMESVVYDGNRFVRTFFNQKSFSRLMAVVSLSVRPWKEHLVLSAEPRLTRYFSRGNDYSHCHTMFRLGVGLDFNYGHWLFYANVMSGPANFMYGEEIIEEKDMNTIMAGYKNGGWAIYAGVFNAFVNDYWMETRNLSALAPYTSKAHSARSSTYFSVKFSFALNFGNSVGNADDLNIDVPEVDSGILSGVK